jgi:hypothetical protein
MIKKIPGQRDYVLIGRRSGIDDVLARLEAFVVRGIPKEGVVLLELRQYFLATRRGIATEYVRDAMLDQERLHGIYICRSHAARIDIDRSQSDS